MLDLARSRAFAANGGDGMVLAMTRGGDAAQMIRATAASAEMDHRRRGHGGDHQEAGGSLDDIVVGIDRRRHDAQRRAAAGVGVCGGVRMRMSDDAHACSASAVINVGQCAPRGVH